jgi:hypothetical protein
MKIKNVMFCVSAVISLIFAASPASAIHLDDGELIADCEGFCIQVEGRAYAGDPCTIAYVLNFDPALPSGSVTGSFDIPLVVGDVGTWDIFEATSCVNLEDIDIACGSYTITGTAALSCESEPLDIPSVPLEATNVVCPCAEGCTPGFWKNNAGLTHSVKKGKELNKQQDNCWCGDYSSGELLTDVFEGIPSQFDGDTLIEALNYGGKGGQEYNMLRHAVAALLNACSDDVGFGLTEEYIIATVVSALNGGDIAAAHNEFAAANESMVEDICIEGTCEISEEECEGESCGSVHNCPIDSQCNPKIL